MNKIKEYIKTLLKLAIQNNPEVLKVVRNAKVENNFDHDGRPGEVGGSTSRSSSMPSVEDYKNPQKDYELPAIPIQTLKKLNKLSKPIILKKNIIKKNKNNHPEVDVKEYNDILSKGLYKTDVVFKTNKNDDYFNFVHYDDESNAQILIELSETKDNYEIVNFYKLSDKSLQRKLKKAIKRVDNEGGQVLIDTDNSEVGDLSNLEIDSVYIITDNFNDFNPSIQNEKWISVKKGDEVAHLPLDGNNKIDTKRIEQWREAERGIKQDLGDKAKKIEVEEPKETDKKEKDFTVKKETQKAVFLSKDGVEFWAPKRFYKNGELTPAGKEIYENARSLKDTTDELEKNGVEFEPSWESEKAYGVDTYFEDYNGKLKPVRVFIPKSQIMKNGNIPLWLFKKKIEELNEKVGFAANKGDYDSGFKTNFYKGKIVTNSKETVYTILDGELYEFEAEDFNPIIKNNVQNNKEQDMTIEVENNKEQDMTGKIENEKEEIRK